MASLNLALKLVAVGLAVGYLVLSRPPTMSAAGSSTATMNVTATVNVNCNMSSPAALAFGTYDPIGANASSNLDVSPNALAVKCTRGAVAQVALDLGSHAEGQTRRLSSGTSFLTYEIYTTSARTTIWNTTNTVAYNAASSATTNLPVYGRIPGGQDVPAGGSYTDTITATINF
jgi:spore coat protein U-like protein